MPGWVIGIIVILIVGATLIIYGYYRDKELTRRRQQQLLGQPDRPIPHYDPALHAPKYLTAAEARREPAGAPPVLDDEGRDRVRAAIAGVTSLPVGYAHADFVNDKETGWAALIDPLVLVCAEPVEAIRELLPLVDLARRTSAPMVVVAPKISEVVLDTLAVNRIQRMLGVLAVTTESLDLQFRIAEQVRAAITERSDLQAGYLPPERVGRCALWVSTAKQTWIVSSATQ